MKINDLTEGLGSEQKRVGQVGSQESAKDTGPVLGHEVGEEQVQEVAPKGWEGTVKAMKKHKEIDNPYALAWSMKNKGYKSHKKESVEEGDIAPVQPRRDTFVSSSPTSDELEKRKEQSGELRYESSNNIAVYINGKRWKTFAGKGHPDSAEEQIHLRKMQAWAQRKSQETGKKWSVMLTAGPVSEAAGDSNLSVGQMMAQDGIVYSPEREKEIIRMIPEYMKKAGYDAKAIRYYFNYVEDFIPDVLNDLPRENVAETKFDVKKIAPGRTQYTRKSDTFVNGGNDSDHEYTLSYPKKSVDDEDNHEYNFRNYDDEDSDEIDEESVDEAELDPSGLQAAAEMVQDYIVTAEVDGKTKKFRVRGMTGPNAAKERFLKHASMAKVIDVKPEHGVAEGRVDQLPTKGADYSDYDTDHLRTLLKPGILHRNEARFKSLIRKELKKREQQSQQGVAEASKDDKFGGYEQAEWDEKMARLKKLAGQGELKTVWDPVKRVYKNVPVNPSVGKK